MRAAHVSRVGCSAPERIVDFDRPLVAILGLPFDSVTLTGAVERIRAAAFARRRCFVSTPNLNFAIAARRDAAFRGSILRSDLSLVDGMPLVWIARLLGLPVTERVSGADVFESLQSHAGAPLNVYVFGGPKGAAAAACERINRQGGGLRCVGFDDGGFGPIESMSSAAHLERINASGAHFLVVALGAAKGQAWIERNAASLEAPVISHLGAVVNFAAGSLVRAPRWMRAAGLEWLWRIKEEPGLWRRYARDAREVLRLFATRVLPDSMTRSTHSLRPPTVSTTSAVGTTTIALHGSWRDDTRPLRPILSGCAAKGLRVVVELRDVDDVGAALVALLLVAEGWFAGRGGFRVVGASSSLARVFHRKMASELLWTDRP